MKRRFLGGHDGRRYFDEMQTTCFDCLLLLLAHLPVRQREATEIFSRLGEADQLERGRDDGRDEVGTPCFGEWIASFGRDSSGDKMASVDTKLNSPSSQRIRWGHPLIGTLGKSIEGLLNSYVTQGSNGAMIVGSAAPFRIRSETTSAY